MGRRGRVRLAPSSPRTCADVHIKLGWMGCIQGVWRLASGGGFRALRMGHGSPIGSALSFPSRMLLLLLLLLLHSAECVLNHCDLPLIPICRLGKYAEGVERALPCCGS